MPSTNETVVNKALGGEELKSILRADFERAMAEEGLLSHYLAYGRIGYDITIRLHVDNPMRPESAVTVASKPKVGTVFEAAPLASTSKDSAASGVTIHRDIKSPNEERLRHGLPLPVVTRGADGTTQTEMVKYPPQPDLGPGAVTVTDETKEVRAAWKTTEAS